MPTSVETELWQMLKKRQFADVESFIERNRDEDLINSINPNEEDGRNVAIYLVDVTHNKKDKKVRELILSVLAEPKFQWDFKYDGGTIVDALFEAAWADQDFSVMEGLLNVPGFLTSGNKLTYELAVKELQDREKLLASGIQKKKPQAELDKLKTSIEKWKKIVSLVRDLTILYALKTDDAELFDRLEKAGGAPLDGLGDFGNGQCKLRGLPEKVMTSCLFDEGQPNPNLDRWREEQLQKTIAHMKASRPAKEEALAHHQDLLKQRQAIHEKYLVARIGVFAQAAKERYERINQAIEVMENDASTLEKDKQTLLQLKQLKRDFEATYKECGLTL